MRRVEDLDMFSADSSGFQPTADLATHSTTSAQLVPAVDEHAATVRRQGRRRFNFRLLIFSSDPTSTSDLNSSGSGSAEPPLINKAIT